jgi:hypothetical protein
MTSSIAHDLPALALSAVPYAWCAAADFLAPGWARELEATFPDERFTLNERRTGSDKTYRIVMNTIVPPGGVLQQALPAPWQRLCDQLLAAPYREAMARLTGVDLSGALIELTLNRYHPGHWLSPHTDKYPKLVTQLFYFSGAWDERWGGRLQILGGPAASDVVDTVAPATGRTALIVRSERSWHAVEPMREHSPAVRRSLQVIFWASAPLPVAPGRRTEGA